MYQENVSIQFWNKIFLKYKLVGLNSIKVFLIYSLAKLNCYHLQHCNKNANEKLFHLEFMKQAVL